MCFHLQLMILNHKSFKNQNPRIHLDLSANWHKDTTLIFEHLKPVEKSKNNFYIIWTINIFKILQINTTFENVQMIFWLLYWFQIFKDQCGSVPSVSATVLALSNLDLIQSFSIALKSIYSRPLLAGMRHCILKCDLTCYFVSFNSSNHI